MGLIKTLYWTVCTDNVPIRNYTGIAARISIKNYIEIASAPRS